MEKNPWEMTEEEFSLASYHDRRRDVCEQRTPQVEAYMKALKFDRAWLELCLNDSLFGKPKMMGLAKAALKSLNIKSEQYKGRTAFQIAVFVDEYQYVLELAKSQKVVP